MNLVSRVCTGLVVGYLAAVGSAARADFAPVVVVESIEQDVVTSFYNTDPFTGLIRHVDNGMGTNYEDRAIVAFAVSGVAAAAPATLTFALGVNNAYGDPIRNFAVSLFQSSGSASLSDFGAPATDVGTVSLIVANGGGQYSLNLTAAQISSIVGSKGGFLGVRFRATDMISSPTIVGNVQLNVAVPEPASIVLVGLGLGVPVLNARRRRSPTP